MDIDVYHCPSCDVLQGPSLSECPPPPTPVLSSLPPLLGVRVSPLFRVRGVGQPLARHSPAVRTPLLPPPPSRSLCLLQ